MPAFFVRAAPSARTFILLCLSKIEISEDIALSFGKKNEFKEKKI